MSTLHLLFSILQVTKLLQWIPTLQAFTVALPPLKTNNLVFKPGFLLGDGPSQIQVRPERRSAIWRHRLVLAKPLSLAS